MTKTIKFSLQKARHLVYSTAIILLSLNTKFTLTLLKLRVIDEKIESGRFYRKRGASKASKARRRIDKEIECGRFYRKRGASKARRLFALFSLSNYASKKLQRKDNMVDFRSIWTNGRLTSVSNTTSGGGGGQTKIINLPMLWKLVYNHYVFCTAKNFSISLVPSL